MSAVDKAVESMIQNLEAKTGRSLADWITLARGAGIAKQRALLMHLKAEHGLSYGYANFIALKAVETLAVAVAANQDSVVIAQYGRAKAGLRPVYDVLIAAVNQFGADVELAPKKTYVSLRRAKQFAIIQPTRATRLDVGINLKGVEPTARLEASGSFSAMVSHRVRVSKTTEVDTELIGWLKQAYDNAGDNAG